MKNHELRRSKNTSALKQMGGVGVTKSVGSPAVKRQELLPMP